MILKGIAKFVCKKSVTSKDGKEFNFITFADENGVLECFNRSTFSDFKFGQDVKVIFETNGKTLNFIGADS